MNAHITPQLVLQITVYESVTILDPDMPSRKETLRAGTLAAHLVSIDRGNRESVEWFVFPEYGAKGLTVQAFRELWKRGEIDVEQKTADNWEDYFYDGQ